MKAVITNPILRGFNPDPSIVRVADDYYIATSTFEWFPGIQLHHSKDLRHWRLIGHALTRTAQLDMKGMDNSEGVYAPALTYSDGKYWLCFSNVNSCRGATWMATPCYLVTADSPQGPWSDPVAIGSYGFDPSLFHDDNGRKYMLNMLWDGRLGKNFFAGIVLQEFDAQQGKLLGKAQTIFTGTELGCSEGPQILKKEGYYYLVTAEGGTGIDHAVTVCRSKSIGGPYEVHPDNPILTSRGQEDAPLQRAGHGFFVATQNGEWYLSHLCSRQISNPEDDLTAGKYSILGRETALQQIHWENNWPYVSTGKTPALTVKAPALAPCPWPVLPPRDQFDCDKLRSAYQTLREPFDQSWISLSERRGFLRIKGRQYLSSRYQQSMLARRFDSHYAQVETAMEFAPESPLQMAGLCAYYARNGHYFLKMSGRDQGEHILQLVGNINGEYAEYGNEVNIAGHSKVYLRLTLSCQWYRFSYSLDGANWQTIGPKLNSTYLSDEGGPDIFRFTGSAAALFVCDISGQAAAADFAYFEYLPVEAPEE